MRFSLVLFTLFFCIFFYGINYGQSDFYKVKVSLKNDKISKLKFYSLDNREDITILNTSSSRDEIGEWEIYGGKDGRISAKERDGKNIFTVEMNQRHLDIIPLEGELAVQYHRALIYHGDTILIKFPQSTRGQLGDHILFPTTVYKIHRIPGDEQGGISSILGVEDLVSFSRIKPESLHLKITSISSDCTDIVKVASAFVTILEIHKREFENR